MIRPETDNNSQWVPCPFNLEKRKTEINQSMLNNRKKNDEHILLPMIWHSFVLQKKNEESGYENIGRCYSILQVSQFLP